MNKKFKKAILASVFLVLGSAYIFADQSDPLQIQTTPSSESALPSASQMNNTPFADQIQQMREMQSQMNQSIRSSMNSPFFGHNPMSQSNFNKLNAQASGYPQTKYFIKGNAYVAELAIPGMDKKNIKIELKNNILTVSGKTQKSEKNNSNSQQSSYSYAKQFSQKIGVPHDADASKIKSNYKNGILTITIPKTTVKNSGSKIIPIN